MKTFYFNVILSNFCLLLSSKSLFLLQNRAILAQSDIFCMILVQISAFSDFLKKNDIPRLNHFLEMSFT